MPTQDISQITGFQGTINRLLSKYPVILQLLKFGAIGVLNTSLDFIVLNIVTKTFGITSGAHLGEINVIGFTLAVIQSYFWNKYWAFSSDEMLSLWKNFFRLVWVGVVGAAAILLVLFGAKATARPSYYVIILIFFVIAQTVLWLAYGLSKNKTVGNGGQKFVVFIVVSLIGLGINSVLLGFISQHLTIVNNPDLNKNLAKILATFISLIWNFIGYKLFVFKSPQPQTV